MKSLIQSFGIFVFSVFFLSVEIKNETIFDHIYDVISPMTRAAQAATENFFGRSVNKTQHYSKKLFDNSVPKVKDSVKSKMSALHKLNRPPQDDIPVNDREELDELIKSHK